MQGFDIVEADIAGTLTALGEGRVSAAELVQASLDRIAAYDAGPDGLNSVVVLNPRALEDARASDERRAAGRAGALEGIPFTVKDSYLVEGLTAASGSPAFADVTARWNAFTVQRLLDAGAVLIGKTNMPPMADGGMQKGLYGRSESPYSRDFLPAAFGSGSSHGSAVATASSFAVFGMGEETVSSGRSPASNNALCAYTPSWGVLSIRGNWPLSPARDVVVPHTRSMPDMLRLLDVIVADDPETRGDFWRRQSVVDVEVPSRHRPKSYVEACSASDGSALEGAVIAVPAMYLGEDPDYPLEVRPSILRLWEQARKRLEAAGAVVKVTDFPLISAYEQRPGQKFHDELGGLPADWGDIEFNSFLAYGWDDLLRANGDPAVPNLGEADPTLIFPRDPGSLPDRYEHDPDHDNRFRGVVARAAEGIADPQTLPEFAQGLRAVVELRDELVTSWMDDSGYDAVVFPANADVAPADSHINEDSADIAWRNGVVFSNGNYALRHVGLPSVTVPMGTMADIGMPGG